MLESPQRFATEQLDRNGVAMLIINATMVIDDIYITKITTDIRVIKW